MSKLNYPWTFMFSNQIFCLLLSLFFRFPNSFSDIFSAISFHLRTFSFWKFFPASLYKNQNWRKKIVFPTKTHLCGLLIWNKLPAMNFNMHISHVITCIPFVIAIRKFRCHHNVQALKRYQYWLIRKLFCVM